ncbi:MAG: Lrp/AsnC family transcriptional regulator [Bacillota bacterium]|nr:Lrp/AsnC family transcriptional regulator [Bacillota bacterium]
MELNIDEVDHQILRILQEDGRITIKELAEQVSMSSPAVAERMRRLEENGVIEGYRAVVNPNKLGLSVHGYLIADVPISKRDQFYRYVFEQRAFISGATVMSGGKEAVLQFCCRDAAQWMNIQNDFFDIAQVTTHLCTYPPFKNAIIDPQVAVDDEREQYAFLETIRKIAADEQKQNNKGKR